MCARLADATCLAPCRFYGDNTDWLGIKNQITSKATTEAEAGAAVCLLCGAGGTARAAAFALQKMAVGRVMIYNRTLARAEQLAAEFGFEAISDFAPLDALTRLDFVVDTLPGSTGFTLPAEQVGVLAKFKPVVLEAAYIPRHTAFVTQAMGQGCRVVEGVEMLFEQGCAQCVAQLHCTPLCTVRAPPAAPPAPDSIAVGRQLTEPRAPHDRQVRDLDRQAGAAGGHRCRASERALRTGLRPSGRRNDGPA